MSLEKDGSQAIYVRSSTRYIKFNQMLSHSQLKLSIDSWRLTYKDDKIKDISIIAGSKTDGLLLFFTASCSIKMKVENIDAIVPLNAGVEALRAVSGAGVNTIKNPLSLKDFVPTESASGGFFDDKKRLLARAARGES